ncbi:AraC family transcriptional regulator [Paenibacillus hemerocallicola]|uniref:AraC family transcriptional regulator n=2 Tax=Paenibacillus hemerocallicola TaxID=1172614 RepID=A0A5C4TFU1_9BACL|nr:AraC family transcriptional regulator [Paenibacillus hemerocallicola]
MPMNIGSLPELAPAVNYASRSRAAKGTSWGPRQIPDCQWFYVVAGEATLQLGPDTYKIEPGECVFYGARSPHLLTIVRPTDYYSLHFSWQASAPEPVHPAYRIETLPAKALSLKAEQHRLDIPGHAEITIPHHFRMPGMEPLLDEIVKEYEHEHLGFSFQLRALLMELITLAVRQWTARDTAERIGKIGPALRAMRERPDRNWSVTELSGLCGYHPSYFTKLFNKEAGTNPKQFLVAERVKQAKQMLLRGESIQSISERLGYSSLHYFSSNFKKETGLTPSEFRQEPGTSSER